RPRGHRPRQGDVRLSAQLLMQSSCVCESVPIDGILVPHGGLASSLSSNRPDAGFDPATRYGVVSVVQAEPLVPFGAPPSTRPASRASFARSRPPALSVGS